MRGNRTNHYHSGVQEMLGPVEERMETGCSRASTVSPSFAYANLLKRKTPSMHVTQITARLPDC